MSSVAHLYQQFDGFGAPAENLADARDEAMEDEKLASFEMGYQAGWDDAVKAQSDEKTKVASEFTQCLQEISFGYHEAVSKISATMQPVMEEIIRKLLPELVQTSLGAHLIEQLTEILRAQVDRPIEIVVATDNVQFVRDLMRGQFAETFEVIGEEGLGDGQAFVRVGPVERQIDVDAVLAGISEASQAIFDVQNRRVVA